MNPSRRTTVAWVLGVWFLAGLLFGLHRFVGAMLRDQPITWSYDVTKTFVMWQTWVLLTPLVLALGRRFPFDGTRVVRATLVHLSGAAACAAVYAALDVLVVPLFQPPGRAFSWNYGARSGWEAFQWSLLARYQWNGLVYAAILAVDHARLFHRRGQERRLRAAQLASQLSRAHLSALKAQLHPHFLFNALNTISALLYRDADTAGRVVGRLTELLRVSLRANNRHEVPLGEELAFLDGYLEIQQTRFQDRLTVRRVVDPAVLDAWVPSLILQPLVENAVQHGIARNPEPGLVEIRAGQRDGVLRLEVRDSGPGLSPGTRDEEAGGGLGLTNVAERLAHLYGAAGRLCFEGGRAGGAVASIEMPLRAPSTPSRAPDVALATYELRPRDFASAKTAPEGRS
jgi:two-component system, LytTR family, sensor kinase